MKQRIEVNGIKCYAYHGCLEQESKIGGHYQVDIALSCDFSTALQTDQLSDTISYSDIYALVSEEMNVRSQLIEHVAGRIFHRIESEFTNASDLRVKITKISPPINGDVTSCAVIIER